MTFKNYAKYYNLLYVDKNYVSESDYIINTIKKYKEQVSEILDIGCGTGKHAALIAEKGYSVTGIDLSTEMIEIAKSSNYKGCEFYIGNAGDFDINKKFDVITSLFHVISYQTLNIELEKVLLNVKNHLNPGGLFIFDFWYTPAVLNIKPSIKIKRLEDQNIKVTRISEPINHPNEDVIDVHFELHIVEKASKNYEIINEQHKMRYFSIPELDFFLGKSGLKSLQYEEWETGNSPSSETWGVCCIAQKINII